MSRMPAKPLPRRRSLAQRAALLVLGVLAIGVTPRAIAREGISAYAFQLNIGQPGAFLRSTWNRPRHVPSSYVLGYVIWRNSLISPLERVGGRAGDTSRTFTDNEATRTFQAYDGIPGTEDAGGLTDFTVGGLVPGQQYGYQVACAYRNGLQDLDGDGMPDVDTELMSPLSIGSGLVTAIAPPTITALDGQIPSSGQLINVNEFSVEWQQTPGADSYVVWVSADPTFRKKVVKFQADRTVPVDQGGPLTTSITLNANKSKLRRANRIFIAIGARRAGDPRPRPNGAIFSSPVQALPEFTPPPPPGSSSTNTNAKKKKK